METNLRAIREARGLTQRELAEELGISNTFISRAEHGSKIDVFNTMRLIADYFDCSLDEIAMRDNKTYEKVLKGEVEDE